MLEGIIPYDRQGKDRPLDEVSNIITQGEVRIPTPKQIESKLGSEENQRAFWVMFGLFYSYNQRSGKPIARHLYDTVRRGPARGVYPVSDFKMQVGLNHDSPEDILKVNPPEKKPDIDKALAAYVTIDLLSELISYSVAYGLIAPTSNGAGRRHGGIIGETNLNDLLADEIIDSISKSPRLPHMAYERKDERGMVRVHLTDEGRKTFVNGVNQRYGTYKVTEDENVDALRYIRSRYQNFAENLLPQSGLDEKYQREILGRFINPILATIDDKLRHSRIYQPNLIESAVFGGLERITKLIESGVEKPAIRGLIPSGESRYAKTLEKTLYWDYITNNITGATEAVVRSLIQCGHESEIPSFLHLLIVKLMDMTDNSSVMGPTLINITNINRKARILMTESAQSIGNMNRCGTSPEHLNEVYPVLSYLRKRHGEKVSKSYKDVKGEVDSAYDEDKKILKLMQIMGKGISSIIEQNKPPKKRGGSFFSFSF